MRELGFKESVVLRHWGSGNEYLVLFGFMRRVYKVRFGDRKEIRELTFWELAHRQRPNTRNVSYRILAKPYLINSADKKEY